MLHPKETHTIAAKSGRLTSEPLQGSLHTGGLFVLLRSQEDKGLLTNQVGLNIIADE